MSKQQLQQPEIDDKEKEELLTYFSKMDKELLKANFEALSMFVRAIEGKPIEPDDVITRLINIKNKMERSRFPTYPLLAKQVYLRLIAKYNKNAQACKDWADLEAEALVAYKGLNWDAYVEMAKTAMTPTEQQHQFYFGATPISKFEKKRRFWQKEKPQEESEFVNP